MSFIKSILLFPFRLIAIALKILTWPLRTLFNRLFGPPPMVMGGPPVDHSAPEILSEKGGIKGQVLYILISIFCVIAVFWAMVAEVDEQVRAEGVIFTPSDVQFVQSRLPGSVVDINVQLGSEVQQGDVLYRLEDEDVTANFTDNEIALNAARAAEILLTAEAEGRGHAGFPADLVAAAPDVVAKEEALFATRKQALDQRLLVLEEGIETLNRVIEEKHAEHRIAKAKAALVAEEISLLTPLVEGGHEPRAMLLAAQTRHHEAEGVAELAMLSAEAEYLVRAQINPQDIADVQPGQVARISLSAYDPSRYGVVMGVVRRVASNTTQPENAMPFYETIIAIPEVAFTKSPEQPVITSGMPLQLDILGGKRTVMQYIMTPIQKSLATAFRET